MNSYLSSVRAPCLMLQMSEVDCSASTSWDSSIVFRSHLQSVLCFTLASYSYLYGVTPVGTQQYTEVTKPALPMMPMTPYQVKSPLVTQQQQPQQQHLLTQLNESKEIEEVASSYNCCVALLQPGKGLSSSFSSGELDAALVVQPLMLHWWLWLIMSALCTAQQRP